MRVETAEGLFAGAHSLISSSSLSATPAHFDEGKKPMMVNEYLKGNEINIGQRII